MENQRFRALVARYRAELLKAASRSRFAENAVGTPIAAPAEENAVLNLPEASPDGDALQEFSPTADTYESFLQNNEKAGFLRVQAFAGPQTIPVANAEVLVTRKFLDSTRRFALGKTDESGILDGIVLPAPDGSLAQQPGSIRPYALYDVRVSHPDYRTEIYQNVPIFDNIKSIQPVRFQADHTGL